MSVRGGDTVLRAPKLYFGVALLSAMVTLSACQNKTAALTADPMATGSISALAKGPSFKRTEQLSKQWNANPADMNVATSYADNLGALGQTETQIGVLKTTADRNPGNAEIQANMGKKILSMGESQMAIGLLERAVALDPQNWKALSALGTAQDQLTRHVEARQSYQAALAIKPGELSIMNNLAMSYALQGQLPQAEQILRDAMAQPGSKALPRIRQNLALVVGLQGRLDESQKIASEDLPPDQVQANRAYLQQMLAKPNTWAQLQDG